MLNEHLELAKSAGLIQNPEESEYDFRKKVFMAVYPEDALQAIEILFCVKHYSELDQRDYVFISMATKLSEQGPKD